MFRRLRDWWKAHSAAAQGALIWRDQCSEYLGARQEAEREHDKRELQWERERAAHDIDRATWKDAQQDQQRTVEELLDEVRAKDHEIDMVRGENEVLTMQIEGITKSHESIVRRLEAEMSIQTARAVKANPTTEGWNDL